MLRNTKNDDNQNDINSIKFGIKDIIIIITCFVSIMIFYFGIVKNIETHLNKTEKVKEKPIDEIKSKEEGLDNVIMSD